MSDRHVKIHASRGGLFFCDAWHDSCAIAGEWFWGIEDDRPDLAVIDNVPVMVRGLAYGDTVRWVADADGRREISEVVRDGGNLQVAVLLCRGADGIAPEDGSVGRIFDAFGSLTPDDGIVCEHIVNGLVGVAFPRHLEDQVRKVLETHPGIESWEWIKEK